LVPVHLLGVAHAAVDARAGLGGLEEGLRCELVPALVGPSLSGRTALRRRMGQEATEEVLDLRLPGVLRIGIGILSGEGGDAGLLQEGLQLGSNGSAPGDMIRV